MYMNKYIVVEGVGYSGKTTVTNALAKETGAFLVFEPGSSKELRDYLKNNPTMDPAEQSLLFLADRIAVHDSIKRYLEDDNVIGDRSFVSNFVYQGLLVNQLKRIVDLHNMFQDKLVRPDNIFIIDVPVHIAIKRSKIRGASKIDIQYLSEFERVRRAYLDIGKKLDASILDGSNSVESLVRTIRGISGI